MRRRIADLIRDRELIELPPAATVREASRLMRDHNVGAVVVIGDGRLVGIITERDIVFRVVAEDRDADETHLDQVMTANPDTITPECPAIEALRQMEDGGYRHLPVVSDGRVVAVLSRRSFFGDEEARLQEETRLWERM